ncbi:MAG: PDZ domain-containing protein [Fimbriimonadaceae bacterium]|nr:PDZ domain-containing protein [Fimbriimonadaceae bacterium]QYK55741.1 MAG: PDZ domain-containing protein [Fimbriimonadaceae bacterium]
MAVSKGFVWTLGGFIAAVACFGGGLYVRSMADVGRVKSAISPIPVIGILASADNKPQQISESAYYYALMQLLEQEFVDPITDEMKLARGAVRGMVTGLLDPDSSYYAEKDFALYKKNLAGEYEGIGVELRNVYDQAEIVKARKKPSSADQLLLIPDIVVSMVVPGGPADKAGVKVGDKIVQIDGRWLIAASEVKTLREAQKKLTDGKIESAEFERLRMEFQKKVESTITPSRTRETLLTGTDKLHKLVVERAGEPVSVEVTTAKSSAKPVERAPDGTIRFRLMTGAAQALRDEKLGDDDLRIDLRQSGQGDFTEIKAVLALLGPGGRYGTLRTERIGEPRSLTVDGGSKRKVPVTLLVDETTDGAANVLARALVARGAARLKGQLVAEPTWIDRTELDDGSGYTLAVGTFVPEESK